MSATLVPMYLYHKILIGLFSAVWLWAALFPRDRADWFLENLLVFFFVPFLLYSARHFRLSDVSYGLITLFLILHVVGSHFTYGFVPFGDFLGNLLGSERNMYDRLVHFSFGLLMAYPIREVFVRITGVRGFWGYYLPFDVTLSFSAIFEIIEWVIVRLVDPAAGIAYLGAQGDIWDAQKDMLLAGTGALLAMTIVVLINIFYNSDFGRDMRTSFRIRRGFHALGERKFFRMLRKK